jgi:phosphohistidine phosphatase
MSLYLVQHGLTYSEAIDPERSLSATGKANVDRIAMLAAEAKVPVAKILHSGKLRARQTAEIMAAHLKPPGGVSEIKGINPLDDVIPIATRCDASEDIMLVGHLPFLENMTSYLITGSTDKTVIKFQNGGIVCLDQEGAGGPWFIKWTLMPEIR